MTAIATPARLREIGNALGREPSSVTEIDDGFDFEVVVVDDEWVFRFPRRPNVAEALEVEGALLPALAAVLPVAVPQFEYLSADPPFAGYRLIRGEPIVDEDPGGVRAFLEALHAFDASPFPVERPDWIPSYRDRCCEFERVVVPLLDVDERRQAAALFAETETLSGFEPVFIHADLCPEHLLVRNGRLVGVIDWGDARIGDPALDYAWLLNVPFPDWDVDAGLRRRSQYYQRLAPWFSAHYGIVTNRPARTRYELAQIRRLLEPAGA